MRASPAGQRELEGPIRILCDASQPTYDRYALGGHHGVARARFGAAATRREGPNHSDQVCLTPAGYCSVSVRRKALARFVATVRAYRSGMAMSADYARYALYLTPPPDSDLWRFGCDVIGRDPLAGASREGFSLEGYPPDSWRSMTSDARRYGFHATLMAPFSLRLDLDPTDMFDSIAEFARKHSPFESGELKVGLVKAGHGLSFVALKPEGALKELRSFEASVVRGLDRLRAPYVETDREYRGSKRLTPRQAYYLHAWGYP